MPQGENFRNPYRWVPVMSQITDRQPPRYHHRLEGVAGRAVCTLEALTPLLINNGRGEFVRNAAGLPFLPATSLKGLIRALAELIGNAAAPFPRSQVDDDHQLRSAVQANRFDVAARMFGYLNRGDVFGGLVRFGDGHLEDKRPPEALSFRVAGGNPDPDHRPFYPRRTARKAYHHQFGTVGLTPPHAGIKADQIRTVRPLPPGVRFRFPVDFFNLRDEELALLLYCLVLEEDAKVTFSPAAVPAPVGSLEVTGPLRHKFGYGKPQGGGSVRIVIERLNLRTDAANRYRRVTDGTQADMSYTGEAIEHEVRQRTKPIVDRTDDTMQALRAMLLYTEADPRKEKVDYPTYAWFREDASHSLFRPLKPTL